MDVYIVIVFVNNLVLINVSLLKKNFLVTAPETETPFLALPCLFLQCSRRGKIRYFEFAI